MTKKSFKLMRRAGKKEKIESCIGNPRLTTPLKIVSLLLLLLLVSLLVIRISESPPKEYLPTHASEESPPESPAVYEAPKTTTPQEYSVVTGAFLMDNVVLISRLTVIDNFAAALYSGGKRYETNHTLYAIDLNKEEKIWEIDSPYFIYPDFESNGRIPVSYIHYDNDSLELLQLNLETGDLSDGKFIPYLTVFYNFNAPMHINSMGDALLHTEEYPVAGLFVHYYTLSPYCCLIRHTKIEIINAYTNASLWSYSNKSRWLECNSSREDCPQIWKSVISGDVIIVKEGAYGVRYTAFNYQRDERLWSMDIRGGDIFVSDDRFAMVAGNEVRCFNLTNAHMLSTINRGQDESVRHLIIDRANILLYYKNESGNMGKFSVYDALTGREIWKKELEENSSAIYPGGIMDLKDNKVLIVRGGKIYLFDIQTGEARTVDLGYNTKEKELLPYHQPGMLRYYEDD